MEGNPGNRKRRPPPPGGRRKIVAPPAPVWLDPESRRVWNETAQGLAEQGMLADQDVTAFAAYCAAVSDWIRARRAVQRLTSHTMKMPGGSRQQAAEVGVMNRAEEVMWRRGEQFGLNGRLNRERMGIGEVDADAADDGSLLSRGKAQ